MKEFIKCSVCGNEFEALAVNRYTAREIAGLFSFTSATLYDAFDCPRCGCQCIVGARKEAVPCSKEDEDNEVQSETCDCKAEQPNT